MAPVDFAAIFNGVSAWEVVGVAACGLVALFGVAFLLERVIFRDVGR